MTPRACIIKHDRVVMYKLCSKLVSLLAQASVFVQDKKTLAYYEICQLRFRKVL
jgi:hypothetical protein